MAEKGALRRSSILQLVGAATLLVALAACTDGGGGLASTDTEAPTTAPTTEPIIILSAEEVGPGAFTPPVDTAPLNGAPTGACDRQALINELAARPDAQREWAAVLSVPQDQVETYINTLEPGILGADTRMTNHGLGQDGRAFAVQSTLTAGTAVLVDTSGSQPRPVTRCKCGNPLLPQVYATTTTTAYQGSTTTYDTTTTTYDDTTTTYNDTTTTYYETTTTEYYPTASEPPYTEYDPGDYDTVPPEG